MSAISAWIKNKKTKVISTFEYLLSDCVVLALLDVGVELPGENHHVLFHLQETQDSRVKTVYCAHNEVYERSDGQVYTGTR